MSLFTKVRGLHPKRHMHNLSHDSLLSHDLGQIVPCFVMEHCIPGSKLSISYSQLTRLQALISPIMSQVDSYIHFIKVPFRLLDPLWTRFIAGEAEVNTDFLYDPPYFTFQGVKSALLQSERLSDFFFPGSLMDFLGYTWVRDDVTLQTTPQNLRAFQAYLYTIKCWYLNENIIPDNSNLSAIISYIDYFVQDVYYHYSNPDESVAHGDESVSLLDLLRKLKSLSPSMCFPHAWGKDYFTSALPFVQVGEPVRLSMADSAPVSTNNAEIFINPVLDQSSPDANYLVFNSSDAENTGTRYAGLTDSYTQVPGHEVLVKSDGAALDASYVDSIHGTLNAKPGITADLSNATAISVLELRIAVALQSYKELTARIGHRYNEYLKGTWNVESRDARLQLPERLGGGKIPVNIADVEQTSASASGTTPLAWLAGKATGFGRKSNSIKTFIEEDCLVLGIMFTQPKSGWYCNQGISRFKTKLTDRFDYFHPKFEHIGEQAILTRELYALAPQDEVFGYQARYAEYKWWPNEVHGQFNTTLDFWHLARKFSSKPTLSPEFIYMQPTELSRVFAVESVQSGSVQNVLTWLHFEVKYLAGMSKYGTPMLLN